MSHRYMFEDQPLKRQEAPKDSYKAASETSGGAKLRDVVLAIRTLSTKYERTARLRALSKRILRPLSRCCKGQGRTTREAPEKQPDALLRLLLWPEEIVPATPDPGKQVLFSLRTVGIAAQTSTELRATRCFVVPADDNHVKRIWTAESQPELREMGRALRGSGVLSKIGVAVEEATVPSSKQAKIVSTLMNDRRKGQTRKYKKAKTNTFEEKLYM